MISRLHPLKDYRLNLAHRVNQPFADTLEVKQLRMLHTGYVVENNIKKGLDISPGDLLAVAKNPKYGNIFSPVRGVVTQVGPRFIDIDVVEATAEDKDVKRYTYEELISIFAEQDLEKARHDIKNLGLGFQQLARRCDTLVVSGLNAEPGMTWADAMLTSHLETVLKGLELQCKLSQPKEVVLVLPRGMRFAPIEGITIKYVTPIYPISVPVLLRKEVFGKDYKGSANIVNLHTLWGLGRVVETGLPLVETVITVGTPSAHANYIVKEGTRVSDVLEHVRCPLEHGDTIVLNGPLRGESISMPERGIPKYVRGLFVIPHGVVPTLEGANPCCNCGECDRNCPAGLSPSMISRYAEFNNFEKCKEWYAEYCVECGLCGFSCIMRRPVLQYIRLAKLKLQPAVVDIPVMEKMEKNAASEIQQVIENSDSSKESAN